MKPLVLTQAELGVLYGGLATLASRMTEIGKISVDAGLTGIALSYNDFEDAHSVLTDRWPTLLPGTHEFSHRECEVLYSATFALTPVLQDVVLLATRIMLMDVVTKAAVDTVTLGGIKGKIDAVLLEYKREEYERGA